VAAENNEKVEEESECGEADDDPSDFVVDGEEIFGRGINRGGEGRLGAER